MALSRRSLLLGAGAVVLTACSNSKDQPPAATGPWEFTDDRGVKITRPSRPAALVAQLSSAAALWDLGLRPVGTFGQSKKPDGTASDLAGDVDVTKVTSISETYGEFGLEKFAALKPDLLIAPTYLKTELWYVPKESSAAIAAICPSLGIEHQLHSVDTVIDRYAALAAALGADLKAAPVVKAKEEFDAASKAVTDQATRQKGLKVLFLSGGADGLYFGNPAAFMGLSQLQKLGVGFVVPKVDPAKPTWESVSWELADKYPADVILYDGRNTEPYLTDAAKYPTFARLPAVRAKQVFAFNPETPPSWAQFAPVFSQFATNLGTVRSVTG
ncbi:ABC transporter substrate-binding protein [Kribbella sp. NPDC058245]|uniref:ABC transporter substrate-binding protein n=1 Tax=Kribbella sp. NPDC058245 TaxID=3346399 RepID=UPI0036EBDAF9